MPTSWPPGKLTDDSRRIECSFDFVSTIHLLGPSSMTRPTTTSPISPQYLFAKSHKMQKKTIYQINEMNNVTYACKDSLFDYLIYLQIIALLHFIAIVQNLANNKFKIFKQLNMTLIYLDLKGFTHISLLTRSMTPAIDARS